MYTWDVLSWIAFREVRPRSDTDDPLAFYYASKWGHTWAERTVEALAARASREPFYLIEPAIGTSYAHPAVWPEAPRFLRWLRAEARKRERRLVSYADLANMLRADLHANTPEVQAKAADHQVKADAATKISQARLELVEALRASKLTAWGIRSVPEPKRRPVAQSKPQYKQIPLRVFLDDLVTITEWGKVGADPGQPASAYGYRGPTYQSVTFLRSEVVGIWRPFRKSEASVAATVRDEGILTNWLTNQMQAMPNSPKAKETVIEEAKAAGLHFSQRGFERAWKQAIVRSGAIKWSAPGRKS